jgi:hypothetical protein
VSAKRGGFLAFNLGFIFSIKKNGGMSGHHFHDPVVHNQPHDKLVSYHSFHRRALGTSVIQIALGFPLVAGILALARGLEITSANFVIIHSNCKNEINL